MKKIIFMLGAILTFGITSAQTEPAAVKTDKTETTVIKQEKQRSDKEAGRAQPGATTMKAEAVSRKETVVQEQDVSKDHVKVTPQPAVTKETATMKKSKKTKKS